VPYFMGFPPQNITDAPLQGGVSSHDPDINRDNNYLIQGDPREPDIFWMGSTQ
jgi:hypothetical protein